MAPNKKRADEEQVVAFIASAFPGFLDGTLFRAVDTDPPDFLGTSADGRRIGLELTSWLNGDQVAAARGRDSMRRDLLRVIDWEKHPRPRNFGFAVIMPRWNEKIRRNHYQALCREFHSATRDVDDRWRLLRDGHWRTLLPEERFSFETSQSDLERYPTLRKYVLSIWFTEPQESNTLFQESWVSTIQDGGLYDPMWAIQALTKAVESKVDRYREKDRKACLDAQNLHKFYLLVHVNPARSSDNTPYQTCAQVMASPVEGLADAARIATAGIDTRTKVFDGIFLLYHLWGAQWLAQIWPDFIPVQHGLVTPRDADSASISQDTFTAAGPSTPAASSSDRCR